ncbi:MAG: phage portal protein [Tenericutes bacterium HGW-Tenericutes-1]|nr:MAG: phage portal protein [Tenericutes bacterium HGW-Tenericutes-1]PKM95798.1 MAG: phage portal protein [Firmicutes bacterium HGW-Firmicutes-1]
MNIIDKTINYFSPQKGLEREIARVKTDILNSGYSGSGASHDKKSMKGWTDKSESPFKDIDKNLPTLRSRSRQLFMNAPIATSAIKTNRTNVVGQGLKLKSRIDFTRLGITQEAADQWEKNTEREFNLWAKSRWCDATRLNNFFELQQIALMSWLMNGDGWALIKQQDITRFMPYSLNIYLIEADRISTPQKDVNGNWLTLDNEIKKAANGNLIYNGVEINSNGAVVAYWICNSYPSDNNMIKKDWTRVEAFGKNTGNPNVLQLMESERCEQYRGVPYLAPVIESLKQISRYTEAELTAAVVTAFFTAFIKQEGSRNDNTWEQSIPQEQRVDDFDPNSYELGAGTINILGPGEDVVIADAKRPASGFDPFVRSILKMIGAALEIPFELLIKSFEASYSASRAALLEAWKSFRMRRTWFADDFCQPIYEIWLSEAVARGRIKAPGYFNDPSIKNAWCGSEWIGPSPGQINPVQEVTASALKVANGFSTRERETMELTGGNFDDNVTQISRENKALGEASMLPTKEGENNNA